MKVMTLIVLILGSIVLLDKALDIVYEWIEAVRYYKKGFRVERRLVRKESTDD